MRGSVRQYARPGREPRWRARYLHPDPPPGRPTAQIERTFRTRAEADRWLRAQLASLDTGRHVAPADQRRKFAELADAWRRSWDDLEPRTREGYESVLRHHLLPAFGATPLSRITVESVEAYGTPALRLALRGRAFHPRPSLASPTQHPRSPHSGWTEERGPATRASVASYRRPIRWPCSTRSSLPSRNNVRRPEL